MYLFSFEKSIMNIVHEVGASVTYRIRESKVSSSMLTCGHTSLFIHILPVYTIKTKVAFLEGRLLSSQSEQSEKFSKIPKYEILLYPFRPPFQSFFCCDTRSTNERWIVETPWFSNQSVVFYR